MFKGKNLTRFTNLFSLEDDLENNDEVILNYFIE